MAVCMALLPLTKRGGGKSQANEFRFKTIDVYVNNVRKQSESYGFVRLQSNWMMTLQERLKRVDTLKENTCYKATLCLEGTA